MEWKILGLIFIAYVMGAVLVELNNSIITFVGSVVSGMYMMCLATWLASKIERRKSD